MSAAFATRCMQNCKGYMPVKIPVQVQRRTCAADKKKKIQRSQFSETPVYNHSTVKLYVLHNVVWRTILGMIFRFVGL